MQFEYVVHFVFCDNTRVIIYLAYVKHDFFQLVVLEYNINEFSMRNIFQRTKFVSLMHSFTNVANLVDRIIFSSSYCEVHSIVNFLEYLKVFLIVDTTDVNSNSTISSFFSRKSH